MLEEESLKAEENFSIHPNQIKCWFDKNFAGDQYFGVGDLVLKWEKAHEEKGKHTKFKSWWIGPYTILEKLGHHS